MDLKSVRLQLLLVERLLGNASTADIARPLPYTFTSLLDFLRRMEPQQINRRELQVLIRLEAFSFTGRSRAQLALVEHIYASAGELLPATDRDPADLTHLEDELPEMLGGHTTAVEWPPERVAADELAHLGFYVVPNDVQQHALRIAEEFSTLDIAALAGQPHNTVVSTVSCRRLRSIS